MSDQTFANIALNRRRGERVDQPLFATPSPNVETMSLRTIETVLRNVPNGVTILARDIGADLVQRGECAALPYKLTWNLPPVGFFVSRHMAQHPTVRSLAPAIRLGGQRPRHAWRTQMRREALAQLVVLQPAVGDHRLHRGDRQRSAPAVGRALIGADGIHSRVRREVFPEAPKPTYTGILNLGGIVQTVRPTGDTYWFSNFTVPDEPGEVAANADEMQTRLIALHGDDPPEVAKILRTVTSIGSYAVYDIGTLPQWHQGKICLIGDAAHAVGPHVGQGASSALEDAFVLAKCLRDLATPEAAFARFEGMRRQRAESVLEQSRATGSQKAPKNWLARRVRDLILPYFLRRGATSAEWTYAYPANWDENILAT